MNATLSKRPVPGQKAIPKGAGTTAAERRLAARCAKTFLGLWSWPNVFRDDSPVREICDLLVVFGRHIIVFSDKDCAFPSTGDVSVDWSRWFRKTALAAAEQAAGAERWIRAHPDRVFTDATCSFRVPFEIPINPSTIFHRVVVARGSTKRTEEFFGGSGSLMVDSKLDGTAHLQGAPGFRPFVVGNIDSRRPFVHVFDEYSFEILLDALDTISDFTRYLQKRQELFEGATKVIACGEEDLLARYLRGLEADGTHGFRVPAGYDLWALPEGGWKEFEVHPEHLAQEAADRVSYTWDRLIEKFAFHQLSGTSLWGGSRIEEAERPLRVMASEIRTRRRMLARTFLTALEAGDKTDRFLRTMPAEGDDAAYVFMTLKRPEKVADEQYRIVRRQMLEGAVSVARVESPTASCVVGIATEPLGRQEDLRSEDLCFTDAPVDDAMRARARRATSDFRIHDDPSRLTTGMVRVAEYPLKSQRELRKGRNRNALCTCGSGKKTKRCCGTPQG